MTDEHHDGVMDREYAAGRRNAPHLKFRYRVRARLAVDAFRERRGAQPDYAVLELGAAECLTLLAIRELLGGRGRFDGVELSDDGASLCQPSRPNREGHRRHCRETLRHRGYCERHARLHHGLHVDAAEHTYDDDRAGDCEEREHEPLAQFGKANLECRGDSFDVGHRLLETAEARR